jgi:hypothetical protein
MVRPGHRTGTTLPDRVADARLTCGQPASQAPFAQVSPKHEHLTDFLISVRLKSA